MNDIEKEKEQQQKTDASNEAADALRISEKRIDELYSADETAEVETVVNTIGGAVDVTQLGVEVAETQKNNIQYWIDLLGKDKDKTPAQIETEENQEKEQALAIVYNATEVDLIGSYRDKARRDLNPDWKTKGFDIMKLSAQVKPQVSDLTKLDRTALSPDSAVLLNFLQSDSPLAKDIAKNIYPKLVATQEKQMIEMFTVYNAFLQKTQGEQNKEKTFLDKAISGVGKDRDKLRNKDVKGGDKAVTILKYAGIAVGGRMAIRGIRWAWNKLFGGGDEKESSDKKGGGRWKWLLGIGGGALVLWLLNKRDDNAKNGNDKFEGGLPGSVPNKGEVIDYINTIAPEQQALATTAAGGINALYNHAAVGVDTLGESSFEKTDLGQVAPGLLFAVLQARHGNVDSILTSNTYYEELIGTEGNIIWQKIKDLGVEGLRALGVAVLSPLGDGRIAEFLKNQTLDKMADYLKGQDIKEETIRQVLRKNLSVITYVNLKKDQLEETIARKYLEKTNKKRSTLDKEEQAEEIDDLINDEDLYAQQIKPEIDRIKSLPLIDLHGNGDTFLGELSKEGILDETLPAETQEKVDDLDKDFEKMYSCDKFDDKSLFEIDPFENGVLSVEGKSAIQEVISTMEEHIDDTGKASFLNSYVPIFRLFSTGDNTEDEILSSYESLMKDLKGGLTATKEKIAQGTFTEEDFDLLKQDALKYKTLNKQQSLTSWGVTDIKNEGGMVEVTLGNLRHTFGQVKDSAIEGKNKARNQGIKLLIKGDTRNSPLKVGDSLREMAKGGTQLYGTLLSAELLAWPIRWAMVAKGFSAPGLPTLIKQPLKGLRRVGGKGVDKLTRRITPAKFYRGRESTFVYDIMHDNISLERATRVAKKLEFKVMTVDGQRFIESGDKRSLLRFAFNNNTLTDEQADLMIKYWENDNVRNMIAKKHTSGASRKKLRKKRDPKSNTFEKNSINLTQLASIDKKILAATSPESQEVLTSLVRNTKNLTAAEQIASDRDSVFKLLRTNHLGKAMTPKSFFETVKLKPSELGKLLSKVSSVDEVKNAMLFIQDSAKLGKIKDPAIFFKKTFLLRENIKTNPLAHFDRLNGATKLKLAVENIDVKGKLGRVSEVMKKTKERLKIKLGSASSPMPEEAAQHFAQTEQFLDDAARNPTAMVQAMQEGGEQISLTASEVGTATRTEVNAMRNFLNTSPKFMKYARGVLAGAGVILGGVQAYGSYSKAQELMITNPDKANVYIDKSMAEAGLAAGGLALLAATGPAGRVTGIAVGVAEGGAWIAKDTYFDVMDAYTTNKTEWLNKGKEAKQEALLHFIAISAGEYDIERSGKESFARFLSSKDSTEFTQLADKVGSESLAAWLLIDEVERDPTGIGLIHFLGTEQQEDKILGDKKLPEGVDTQRGSKVKEILQNVENRTAYLKNKIGVKELEVKKNTTVNVNPMGYMPIPIKYTNKTEVMDRETALGTYGKDMGIQAFLLQQLNESRLSLREDPSYHDGKHNQETLEQLGATVTKDPRYKSLNEIFQSDRNNLLFMSYASQDFRGLYQDIRPQGQDKQTAQNNMQYLQEYLSYTSWKTGRDISMPPFAGEELVYDQTLVKNFLITLSVDGMKPAAIEAGKREQAETITDTQFEQQLQHSPNVLQNVLYDIATQVYGMHIENTMEAIQKIFTETEAERFGLYLQKNGTEIRITYLGGFDGAGLSIDPTNQLTTLKKVRDSIAWKIKDGKGSLLKTQTNSGREMMNKELGGEYLRIIDGYYNRLLIGEGNNVVPAYSRILFDIDKCADSSKNGWFELPPETLTTGMMLGLQDMGTYLYRQREDGQYEVWSKEKGEQLLSAVYPKLT